MEKISKDGFYFLLKKDGIDIYEIFKDEEDKSNKTPYYLRPTLWTTIKSKLDDSKIMNYFSWLFKYHRDEIDTQLAITMISILSESKAYVFIKSIYKNLNMDIVYYYIATHPECYLTLLQKIDKMINDYNLKPRDCDRWIDVNHGRIITDIGKMIGYRANKLFDYIKKKHPDPSIDDYWCVPVAIKYRNYKLVYSYLTHMDIDTTVHKSMIQKMISKDRGLYMVDSNTKMNKVYFEYVQNAYK